MAEAVQRRMTSVAQLDHEVRRAGRSRTALATKVLRVGGRLPYAPFSMTRTRANNAPPQCAGPVRRAGPALRSARDPRGPASRPARDWADHANRVPFRSPRSLGASG